MPNPEQIEMVKELLVGSIKELITKDSDILNSTLIEPEVISDDAKFLNRKLHETCINHRLAYYIEKNILGTSLEKYCVDIEYNRFYNNQKLVRTIAGQIEARPDIIVHTRTDKKNIPQHYLVIEAKKDAITEHDENKIKGFITDVNYNYVFGLTVSYWSNEDFVMCSLYYLKEDGITHEPLKIPK